MLLISHALHCAGPPLGRNFQAAAYRNRKLPVLFCLLILSCACQRHRALQPMVVTGDTAPGKIVVDVLESRWQEHYYKYVLEPTTGAITLASEETFSDHQHERISHEYSQPTGATSDCSNVPTALSPDGKYVAGCRIETVRNGTFSVKYFQIFFIGNARTGIQKYQWNLDEWRLIRGFAWSPNSQSVAVLNTNEQYGRGPIESFWAWAGHPVPHDTVYVTIVPIASNNLFEYEIRGDVLYAFTRILNWAPQ